MTLWLIKQKEEDMPSEERHTLSTTRDRINTPTCSAEWRLDVLRSLIRFCLGVRGCCLRGLSGAQCQGLLPEESVWRQVSGADLSSRQTPQFEVLQSEVLQSEVLQFEVLQFEVLQFDVLQFELLQFEVLQFEVLQSEVLQFEVLQFEVLQFEVLQSEVLQF
ncbi:hypothetical protein ACOMHN_019950 [Nucella lapillus]